MMVWKAEDRADGRVLVLSGFITEEADFRPLVALPADGPLRLDLAGVEQINSCGVREWIHFVRSLREAGRAFEFLRCSPAIVRQLNTISNFRGGGLVRSVLLPYYCASCGTEDRRPLDLPPPGRPLPAIEEAIACAKCQAQSEFDDLPDTYLAFAA
jgi:ABC-type transporter Mla MlaB component